MNTDNNTTNNHKPAFRLARVREDEGAHSQTEIVRLSNEPRDNNTMNRREFIGTGITAAAALVFLGGCGDGEKKTGVLLAHKEPVNSVFISPDGKWLASGSSDGTIKLWNMEEHTLFKTLNTRYAGKVWCVFIHKNDEQTTLLAAHTDISATSDATTITRWSLPDGKQAQEMRRIHGGTWTVCATPDGKRVVAGTYDGPKLWSTGGVETMLQASGGRHSLQSLSISNDGKLLASGLEDGSIALWNLPEGTLLKTLKEAERKVGALCISRDKTLLAARCGEGTIQLWNLSDSKLIKILKVAGTTRKKDSGINYANDVRSLCISPDGKWLAAGCFDNTIKLWSLPDGNLVKTLVGHADWVRSICISHDGKLLASGSEDKTVRLWSFPDGELITCLADLESSPSSEEGACYSVKTETGQTITYVLPRGAAIPAGATCTCNCVPGSIKPPPPASNSNSNRNSRGGGGGGRCICMAVRCRRS